MRRRLLAAMAALLLLCGSTSSFAMSRYPPYGGTSPVLLPVLLTPDAAVSMERQRLVLVDGDRNRLDGEMVLRNSGDATQVFQVGFPIVCPFRDYPDQLVRLTHDGVELSRQENLRITATPDYNAYRTITPTDELPATAMEYREQWASLKMDSYWQLVKDNPPYQPSLPIDELFEGTTYTLTILQNDAYAKAIISCDTDKTLLMVDMDSSGSPRRNENHSSISTSSVFFSDREGVESSISFTLYWRGTPPEVEVETYGTVDKSTPVYRLEQAPAPTTTIAKEVGKQLLVYDSEGNLRQESPNTNPAQGASEQPTAWDEPFKQELAYRLADSNYADEGMLYLNPISYSHRSYTMTVTRVVDITLEPGETTTLAWSRSLSFGYDEALEKRKTLYYSVIDHSAMSLWQQVGDTTVVLTPKDSTRNVLIDGVPVDWKLNNTYELSMDGVPSEPLFVSWQQRTKSHLSLPMQLFFFGLLALYCWPITLLVIVLIVWLIVKLVKKRKLLRQKEITDEKDTASN